MKNLSFFFVALLILFATVQGSVENKYHHKAHKYSNYKYGNKKGIHSSVKVKTDLYNIKNNKVEKIHKTQKVANYVAPKYKTTASTQIQGNGYIPPIKVDKASLHLIKPGQEPNKKEEKSSSKGTITFVGLALVAAAVGGVSYRNKAKKQLINSDFNEYAKSTPKDLVYTFNPNQYREDQSRINIYEDEPTSHYESSEIEETINFNVTLPTNRAYKVILPWNARCIDEIELNCGDLVCIKECYQDGYSLGRNLTTRFDGIFPTYCLGNIGTSINQQEVSKWQAVGMHTVPKRSNAPTKKAKRASRGISLLTIPDWTKKLEKLKLDSTSNNIFWMN